MFNKNVDLFIVGKNYLSFLLGIENLKKKRNVLIVDDERYKLGKDFIAGINEFEKQYLEFWTNNKEIDEFYSFDQYVERKDLIFLLGNKRIRLGRDYWSNTIEIIRKFNFNWDHSNSLERLYDDGFKDDFNQLMDFYLKDLAQRIGLSKHEKAGLFNTFIETSPEIIKNLFYAFKAGIIDHKKAVSEIFPHVLPFIFVSKGFYQIATEYETSDTELFHLFLSLISPYYQVKEEELIRDLKEKYTRMGGAFKKTQITDWSFSNNSPWAVELSSYEGILHPKKTALFFGNSSDPSLKIEPEISLYSTIGINSYIDKKESYFARYIICSDKMVGTDRPFWMLDVHSNQINGKCFLEHRMGTKLSFLKEEMLLYYKNELKNYFPHLYESVRDYKVILENDICLAKKISKKTSNTEPGITYIGKEENDLKIKNVYYFGPFNKGTLGTISTFMEINRLGREF